MSFWELSSLLSYWQANKSWSLTYGVIAVTSIYILGPTLTSLLSTNSNHRKQLKDDPSNKRVDKYTTGLYNRGNYCYINSSLQSLSSLEELTKYLESYLQLLQDKTEQQKEEIANETILHNTLSQFIADLQITTLQPRAITNKPIVECLEKIFQGKLSTTQNDAHEFVQIILGKLSDENKVLKSKLNGTSMIHFPFYGQNSSHYVCLRCHTLSEIHYQDQLIYELSTPQKYSSTLEEMIDQNESDIIEDYSCLYCQISALLNNEASDSFNNSDLEEANIRKLRQLLPTLKINSDLPDRLLYYIKSYDKKRCIPSRIKSTIVKKVNFSKCPKSLVIHLSRSMYNGMVMTRNPCRVSFPEEISIHEKKLSDRNGSWQTKKIRYILKSMVKHTGSHYQGHYQCYRHKPDFIFDPQTKEVVNQTAILDYTVKPNSLSNDKIKVTTAKETRKYRKLKTVRSYPYWLLSDDKIKEVRGTALKNEDKYVYMLYYELKE